MKCVQIACFGLCISLLVVIFSCLNSVEAHPIFITNDVDFENNQKLIDLKSIDDLLGPDINFPFDPENHRDSSNPIKRIGKINDNNL